MLLKIRRTRRCATVACLVCLLCCGNPSPFLTGTRVVMEDGPMYETSNAFDETASKATNVYSELCDGTSLAR